MSYSIKVSISNSFSKRVAMSWTDLRARALLLFLR
jgi:hypothetical protein